MNDELLRAASLIREGRRFGLASHVDPDGDSAGSLIASMLMLSRLGKEGVLLQNQPVPDIYAFLPEYELTAALDGDAHLGQPGDLDSLIILDCPNLSRVAWDYDENSIPGSPVINIDHHKDNSLFGHVNIVDGRASSTAELLFGLVEEFGLASDAQIATSLYTGMSTDTGSFSYSNTTPEALRIAAKLVEAGVDVAFVSRNLQCNFTLPRLMFLGEILASSRSALDGSVVWMLGTDAMRRETDFWGSTEQFANYAMKVGDAQVALLFLEDGAGRYKVSIRSRGQIDAGRLAGLFGGGGHQRAAGCRAKGELEAIVAQMTQAIDTGLRRVQPT